MREKTTIDTLLGDKLESILQDYEPHLEELYTACGGSLKVLADWLEDNDINSDDLLEECHWSSVGDVRLYKCTNCGNEQYAEANENIYCEECDDAELEEL